MDPRGAMELAISGRVNNLVVSKESPCIILKIGYLRYLTSSDYTVAVAVFDKRDILQVSCLS